MLKRKKFYLPPPDDGFDLKQLLHYAVTQGIGRPVASDGYPDQAWTAETLADAISEFQANSAGVETRTVQHWLQQNNAAMSAQNMRWLARIFGCDEPTHAEVWLTALIKGKQRLRKKERAPAETPPDAPIEDPTDETRSGSAVDIGAKSKHSIASMSERMFHGRSILNMPGTCWAAWYLLLFATMISGLHQITYITTAETTKQIGFLWSVSWTINPIFAIPVYTMIIYKLLSYWKFEGRHLLLPDQDLMLSSKVGTQPSKTTGFFSVSRFYPVG